MLSTDFSTNCAPNFSQNTDILITLGNTKTKDFECTIAYNKIESCRVMFFYISTLFLCNVQWEWVE